MTDAIALADPPGHAGLERASYRPEPTRARIEGEEKPACIAGSFILPCPA